jgi:hypothetical protein
MRPGEWMRRDLTPHGPLYAVELPEKRNRTFMYQPVSEKNGRRGQ